MRGSTRLQSECHANRTGVPLSQRARQAARDQDGAVRDQLSRNGGKEAPAAVERAHRQPAARPVQVDAGEPSLRDTRAVSNFEQIRRSAGGSFERCRALPGVLIVATVVWWLN